MGSKKKILVCGPTSFVMSNFIRYILYRSQDYSIVSVDNLEKLSDFNRIYFNRKHRFYIGDAANKHFMDRIIFVEKPDFILFGDEILEFEKMLSTSLVLTEYGIPTFFIQPAVSETDYLGFCYAVATLVKNRGSKIICLPNKFGMRQRADLQHTLGGNVSYMMKNILEKKEVFVSTKKVPWVYGEDIASYIWYLLEHVKMPLNAMPELGMMSEKEIAEKIVGMYNLECKIKEIDERNYGRGYLVSNYDLSYDNLDWKPDSESLDQALEKTIRWFDANRWALNEY